MPTRILDWSRSLLAAMFFAVEKDPEEDGVVWSLLPTKLSLDEHSQRLNALADDEIRPYVVDAFKGTSTEPARVLSVVPRRFDLRHLVQQTAFTIHGKTTPLEDLSEVAEEGFLRKFLIPRNTKAFWRRRLEQLGTTRASLFPDLPNLGAFLAQARQRPGEPFGP